MSSENLPVPRGSVPAGVPMSVDPTDTKGEMWTSLDLALPVGKARLLAAMEQVDEELWETHGTSRPVQDVVVWVQEEVDQQTGELVTRRRTVLVSPDGSTAGTSSMYAFRALKRIVILYGRPPWVPALVIRPVRKHSRNQRDYLTLDVV